MRRIVLICLALAFCSAFGELPFPIGEVLTYTISWNGIPVAWAESSAQMETFEGRDVLALRVRAQTYSFFNHIFKVDDVNESLIDPVTFLPIRYTKNLQEGSYRCHEITTFDYEKGMAHYEQQTGKKVTKSYEIGPDTRDLISFMYFLRSELLEENQKATYRVMSDEKIYELILSAEGVEGVDLPRYEHDVPSLKMEPEAKFDGLFVRKGKATVWISRDSRRLLTFAKIKVPFGRARVTLRSVSGPGEDFWITEKKDGDDEK
ncbi:MAG: DUF3108 domain-containing protein [Verrucomicrobia bacterium]|nr:DUF3108 domain-containing protein [Verrucomicrobiota bacterium]